MAWHFNDTDLLCLSGECVGVRQGTCVCDCACV